MAKSYSKVTVKGVGTSKQIRRTVQQTIPGLEFKLKLSGVSLGSDLADAVEEANNTVASMLGDALDKALSSSVWEWSSGPARDIIDTGELLRSRSITVQDSRILITYNVPYAGIVHFGGYVLPYGNNSAQKVYIPARPWIDATILGNGPVPEFDFESIYRQAIAKVF